MGELSLDDFEQQKVQIQFAIQLVESKKNKCMELNFSARKAIISLAEEGKTSETDTKEYDEFLKSNNQLLLEINEEITKLTNRLSAVQEEINVLQLAELNKNEGLSNRP